jgi:hypothetical protein
MDAVSDSDEYQRQSPARSKQGSVKTRDRDWQIGSLLERR